MQAYNANLFGLYRKGVSLVATVIVLLTTNEERNFCSLETGSENKKLQANQTETRKATKKSSPNNNSNSNLQWGVGKQTSPVRNDKKVVKSNACAETKKSSANKNSGQNAENVVDSSKLNASSKISARFNSVPANQRKLQRCTKRREGTYKTNKECVVSIEFILKIILYHLTKER